MVFLIKNIKVLVLKDLYRMPLYTQFRKFPFYKHYIQLKEVRTKIVAPIIKVISFTTDIPTK